MYHQEGSDTLYVGGQAMIYVLTFTNRGVDDIQVTKSLKEFSPLSFRQSLLLLFHVGAASNTASFFCC